MKRRLGLIGYPLTHSFSKEYFRQKFAREGIGGYEYELYPLEKITDLPALLERQPALEGLNVTIPHKINVLPYLHELDEAAAAIGAVNTIRIRGGKLKGYNTDVYGFRASLKPLLQPWHRKALILGTGGASRAIIFVLQELGIDPVFVSRNPEDKEIAYDEIDHAVIHSYPLIINCTPLGTFPDIDQCPDIPYDELSDRNLLFDLVYNPEETLFLKKGKEKGAQVRNGLEMLRLQAEKSWEIWTTGT